MAAEVVSMEGPASMTAGGGRKKEYSALLWASDTLRSAGEWTTDLKWEAKGGHTPADASSCCTCSVMLSSALASRQDAQR